MGSREGKSVKLAVGEVMGVGALKLNKSGPAMADENGEAIKELGEVGEEVTVVERVVVS